MSGVYITGELADQVAHAEEIIRWHVTGCASCTSALCCRERDRAEGLLAHYGLLPRRVPGWNRLSRDVRPHAGIAMPALPHWPGAVG